MSDKVLTVAEATRIGSEFILNLNYLKRKIVLNTEVDVGMSRMIGEISNNEQSFEFGIIVKRKAVV